LQAAEIASPNSESEQTAVYSTNCYKSYDHTTLTTTVNDHGAIATIIETAKYDSVNAFQNDSETVNYHRSGALCALTMRTR